MFESAYQCDELSAIGGPDCAPGSRPEAGRRERGRRMSDNCINALSRGSMQEVGCRPWDNGRGK